MSKTDVGTGVAERAQAPKAAARPSRPARPSAARWSRPASSGC